jgi:hypothetical protein
LKNLSLNQNDNTWIFEADATHETSQTVSTGKLRVDIFALIHDFELTGELEHKFQCKCIRSQKALQARNINDFKEYHLIFVGH